MESRGDFFRPHLVERPLISVVTVVDGDGPALAGCLTALQQQSHEHWEHIILTTGERLPAETWDAAAADSRLRLYEFAESASPGQSWNMALQQISRRSQYCMFLDPEERLVPEALTQLLAVAQCNPAAGVVGCRRARGDAIEGIAAGRGPEALAGRTAACLHLRAAPRTAPLQAALIQAPLVRSRPRFCSLRYQHPEIPAFLDLMLRTDFAMVPQVLSHSAPTAHTASRERQITWIRDWLMCLQEYGPRHLDRSQLRQLQRGFLKLCHRALVRSMLSAGERQYLAYYIAQAGGTPNFMELIGAAASELVEALRPPFRSSGITIQTRG